MVGSGILEAKGIRNSNDVDVVCQENIYRILKQDDRFSRAESYGLEILTDELFEIGTSWGVLGKNYTFNNLIQQSVVIDGVRYITLEFLLAVKESWIKEKEIRQKDVDDVALIKVFLNHK